MEKIVKSPSKEREKTEKERKKAEDREKRKSGSHGHVWFGFKQDSNKEVAHAEKSDSKEAAAAASSEC